MTLERIVTYITRGASLVVHAIASHLNMTSVASINPATGETLETFEQTSAAALDRILDAAVAAQHVWRGRSWAQRAQPMRAAARLLRERSRGYARTMAPEMGKPVKPGGAEAGKCASAWR